MKTNNNFHILIVDDEMFNIELAAAYLKEDGYKISYATNALGSIESINSKKIDLILLDINMPNKDGFEICTMLKSENKTKDIPIIFLTAQTTIEYISRAFEVGGIDYINKPFNPVELKARVKTHLQTVANLEEIKNKQSKLAQLSITDSLTKLHNSLYFDSKITQYQNANKKFWVICIQINKFDRVNQLYGFYGANKILRLFSKLILKESFSNVVTARLYGASFGILVNDYEKKLIEKMHSSIFSAFIKNKELSASISFSTLFLYVDKPTTLPIIYKKLQTNMQSIKDENESPYVFIT